MHPVFGYAFPFEGNWNVFCLILLACNNIFFWIRFPVWRELKLSTKAILVSSLNICFGYAFPFEGNWNQWIRLYRLQDMPYFWIRFPVWRELKRFKRSSVIKISRFWIRFPVWRELKRGVDLADLLWSTFWIRFPVWRELKRTSVLCLLPSVHAFGYAFPFEGNWNMKLRDLRSLYDCCFWIRFPVWRELKLGTSLSSALFALRVFWIRFPVWRELKLYQIPLLQYCL